MNSGIYQILNTVNGHKYIGSTVNFQQRWNRHRSMLRNGTHHAKRLQNSWDKYGEPSFKFEIIFLCDREELINNEQIFIDKCHPEYNVNPIAESSRDRVVTDETRIKLSIVATGRVFPEEVKKKISRSHMGKKMPPITEESKILIGMAQKGKIVSLITREKISASHMGMKYNIVKSRKPMSEETKQKIRNANLGKKLSEITKEKLRKYWDGTPKTTNQIKLRGGVS